ncbi:MAG TPA: hypothetical protein VL172_13695 [Kofleriaceae bacterium]|nr:hypothetical protein [Kofleriaceae bacterium]
MSFEWMNPEVRADRERAAERRRAMFRAELEQRAALLRRMGYSKARVEARLRANLDWDFEVGAGPRPDGLNDAELTRIVKAAFAR